MEKTISEFYGKEDTILYPSCFDANGGIFESLLAPEDAVISDALNHASIIDGIRLCKATKYRYKHLDMDDLREQLKQAQKQRVRLIVTDGVFSMDGDIAPLDKIVQLAKEYDALVMIDECHAAGFLGKNGKGTPELFGVLDEIDIINGTLGKALGGASGGYTSANSEVVNILRFLKKKFIVHINIFKANFSTLLIFKFFGSCNYRCFFGSLWNPENSRTFKRQFTKQHNFVQNENEKGRIQNVRFFEEMF